MRATDRTLLASLGFADRDKGNSDHGLICQFLTEGQQMDGLCSKLDSYHSRDVLRARIEVPITKGNGQYRSVVGFIDVLYETQESGWPVVGIEVKAGPFAVDEAVRQIKLYKIYVDCVWVLATPRALHPSDERLLQSERITPVVVSSFVDWKKRRAEDNSPSGAIEL